MIYNDRKIAIDPPHRDADDVNSFGAKLALRQAGKQGRAVFDVSPAEVCSSHHSLPPMSIG